MNKHKINERLSCHSMQKTRGFIDVAMQIPLNINTTL